MSEAKFFTTFHRIQAASSYGSRTLRCQDRRIRSSAETDYSFTFTAPRPHRLGGVGDYLVDGDVFLGGEDQEYVLDNPDTGIMRITLNPDTLNAGSVRADVSIQTIPEHFTPTKTISGSIENGVTKQFTYQVNEGTKRLELVLTWDHNWAHYPTSDVDLIVFCPPSSGHDSKM